MGPRKNLPSGLLPREAETWPKPLSPAGIEEEGVMPPEEEPVLSWPSPVHFLCHLHEGCPLRGSQISRTFTLPACCPRPWNCPLTHLSLIHKKGTATGARWKPLSSDFHNLALSDEERVGERVQEMLSPRLATLTICAKVVVINTRQAQLLRKF